MKGFLFVTFCFVAVTLIHCHTIGETLDSGIEDARQDVKDAGRVISKPFRYVGEKAGQAVEATRHAAGGVVEGAGNSLKSAGSHISGRD